MSVADTPAEHRRAGHYVYRSPAGEWWCNTCRTQLGGAVEEAGPAGEAD